MGLSLRHAAALMAGGVVLAGGGVTTLAAWQDQTWTRAPLSLSSFDVLQNTGAGWVQAELADAPGVLNLFVRGSLGAALVPGGATTGWVDLRTATGSLGAAVTLNGASVGTDTLGLASKLTYQAASGVGQQQCQDGDLSAGTTLVPAGTPLGTGSSAVLHLPAATATQPGADVGVCFKVSLQDGISRTLGGGSLSPVWRFDAVSE